MSGYILTKAERLLKVGVEIYRNSDALGEPDVEYSSARIEIIAEGARQLTVGQGFEETSPLSNIGVEGFYDLVRIFHFEVCGQVTLPCEYPDKILDKMTCCHIVTEVEVTLFNLVDSPFRIHRISKVGRNP